jgi:hypothetical protein
MSPTASPHDDADDRTADDRPQTFREAFGAAWQFGR